ncbi:hypothetical protein ACOME3_009832 [Neoechinorhynchus agilis]
MFLKSMDSTFISVCSFNILSQAILEETRSIYNEIDEQYLKWEHRRPLILETLCSCKSDILCLQEMQADHYERMREDLATMGYGDLYAKRDTPKCDGCAVFFKKTKFSVREYLPVNLKVKNSVLDRANVAQVVIFKHLTKPAIEVCIVNVHLCFNPKRGDVKLAQMIVLLAEIHRLTRIKMKGNPVPPIILSGDFNAVSDSPLWRFIVGEKIDLGNVKRDNIPKNDICWFKQSFSSIRFPLLPKHLKINSRCEFVNDAKEIEDSIRIYEHGLKFKSVHPGNMKPFGLYSWNGPFSDYYVTVDHVFYSNGDDVALNPVFKTKDHYPHRAGPNGPIPSISQGSDHYMLRVDFRVQKGRISYESGELYPRAPLKRAIIDVKSSRKMNSKKRKE